MTLRDDINATIHQNGIEGFQFSRLTIYENQLQQIAERFLQNGTRDLNNVWLWSRFRAPTSSIQLSENLSVLKERLSPEEVYWFLASEQNGKHWVCEGTGSAILQVLSEMYYFEYYIVDWHLSWILCENHHGALIFAGTPPPIIEMAKRGSMT